MLAWLQKGTKKTQTRGWMMTQLSDSQVLTVGAN